MDYYLLSLVTDVIWPLQLHHGTAFWCGFLFLIISFFFYPSCLPQSRGGELTEIGKCWCAASDIVSDHDDNSAKKEILHEISLFDFQENHLSC